MKKIATIAVFVMCSFVGFHTGSAPAATNASCYATVWVGGQSYSGFVQRSWRTSCPFARRVTAKSLAYIVHAGGEGDGDFYVRVYSPVTHKTYRTHCFANGSLYTSEQMHVTCYAGVGAKVKYVARKVS